MRKMTKENNRHLEVRIQETRMVSNGDMMVSGYVNMTDTLSYELGFIDKFVEKIAPGTFTRAINRAQENGQDIDFLAEHNDTLVLASTKNGTLSLTEDETGLYMEARIINTSSGRDYHEMIKSGIITNMSFGFYAVEDDWRSVRNDLYERTVTELELFEVSAVRRPAYAASSISGRGLNLSDEEVPEYIRNGERSMENNQENELLEAIIELTKEVRELKQVSETRDEDKDKEAKAKKKEKEYEDKEGVEDPKGKKADTDKEKLDAKKDGDPKPDPVDKKAEGDKDKESTSEKDAIDEVEKERKKKEEEDKKKRSYSLLREEFKNLRGGNE